MKFLHVCVRWIDWLNEKLGLLIAWLTTLLVLVVCYDVFSRYLLKKSIVAVQELEWHLFAMIFLLGAAYTLKHDKHVRVDVIFNRLSPKKQAWVNLVGSLFFLIPFCLLVMWASMSFVSHSFAIREVSPDPGGLPARYLLKAAIPVGFFFLLLQGISQFFSSLLAILDTSAPEQESAT